MSEQDDHAEHDERDEHDEHDEHDEPMPEGEEEPPPGWRAMAVVRWLLVVAMGVLATLSIAHYFGWTPHAHAESAKPTYYCPMHPGVQQDHPGDCPICGMTLVLKTDTAPSASASANASANASRNASASPSASASASLDPYYCPMHPGQTSKNPNAKCPVCDAPVVAWPEAMLSPAGPMMAQR